MIRYLFSVLLATQLIACASLPPIDQALNDSLMERNRLKVLAINEWRLVGRLAVRGAKDSWLSRLDWEHGEGFDTLLISTSLGGVVAELRFDGSAIYFTDSDGTMRIISEGELEAMLGYVPPIKQLKFWLRGIPEPSRPVIADKLLISGEREFMQGTWLVKVERFTKVGDVLLPKKITTIRQGMKVKLVVEKWMN